MKLLPEWKILLKKAWSIRWWGVAVILSGLESAFQYADGAAFVPPGLFAMLGSICGIAGMYARTLYQPIEKPAEKDD